MAIQIKPYRNVIISEVPEQDYPVDTEIKVFAGYSAFVYQNGDLVYSVTRSDHDRSFTLSPKTMNYKGKPDFMKKLNVGLFAKTVKGIKVRYVKNAYKTDIRINDSVTSKRGYVNYIVAFKSDEFNVFMNTFDAFVKRSKLSDPDGILLTEEALESIYKMVCKDYFKNSNYVGVFEYGVSLMVIPSETAFSGLKSRIMDVLVDVYGFYAASPYKTSALL